MTVIMEMLESHKTVKRKAKGKDHNSGKASFFLARQSAKNGTGRRQDSDREATGRRQAADEKATGKPQECNRGAIG